MGIRLRHVVAGALLADLDVENFGGGEPETTLSGSAPPVLRDHRRDTPVPHRAPEAGSPLGRGPCEPPAQQPRGAVRTVSRVGALHLQQLVASYGAWAVLVIVGIESTGIPVPGETALLSAALYAGTSHRLGILVVVAAAAAGAILGDNLGFLIGTRGGFRLLRYLGTRFHIDQRKLKLGQYLFRRHGGKVVFFGRFVAVLRSWAAFLAGTNRMPWPRFLVCNAAGGITWAALYGFGAYFLGNAFHRVAAPVGIALGAAAAVAIVVAFLFLRRNEKELEDRAERALPGPLEA